MGRRSEQRPHQRGYTDGKQPYEKISSTSYVIRELQIKTTDTITHPLEWLKSRTLIPNTEQDVRATGTLIHWWWECKLI